jgi:hypothetical protein
LYQLNPVDFEIAYKDAVTMASNQWFNLLEFVYGIRLLNSKKSKEEVKQDKNEEEKYEVEDDLPDQVESKIGDELKNKKYENLGIWVECNMYFKNFKRIK